MKDKSSKAGNSKAGNSNAKHLEFVKPTLQGKGPLGGKMCSHNSSSKKDKKY